MPDEEDDEVARRGAERLAFFSDAVVAIAITLLAIDLPVPAGHTPGEIWSDMREHLGEYLAFLVSFRVVAGIWAHHHDLFGYVRRYDARLRSLNAVWLFAVVLTPFAAKTIATRGHMDLAAHALRFGFYALLQTVAAGAILAMVRHLRRTGEAPAMPTRTVDAATRQSYALILGFGLSIPVFFLTPLAWVLWIVVPPAVSRGWRARARRL